MYSSDSLACLSCLACFVFFFAEGIAEPRDSLNECNDEAQDATTFLQTHQQVVKPAVDHGVSAKPWDNHLYVAGTRYKSGSQVLHIQKGGSGANSSSPPSYSCGLASFPQEERLQRTLPFAIVHIPKTSTPIYNAIITRPGVCDDRLPDDHICDETTPDCTSYHNDFAGFYFDHGFHDCPGLSPRFCGHSAYGFEYEQQGPGHGLIMLRQPEQRLWSAFYNPCMYEPALSLGLSCPHGWAYRPSPQPSTVYQYATQFQGCGVKMVSDPGIDAWPCLQGVPPPSQADVKKAVERLSEGFAFVGIVEQYNLSVCLFHKMFGGDCDQYEVGRFHDHHEPPFNINEFHGFQDPYDGALYEEGLRIFNDNLEIYDVSELTCKKCFEQAGLE